MKCTAHPTAAVTKIKYVPPPVAIPAIKPQINKIQDIVTPEKRTRLSDMKSRSGSWGERMSTGTNDMSYLRKSLGSEENEQEQSTYREAAKTALEDNVPENEPRKVSNDAEYDISAKNTEEADSIDVKSTTEQVDNQESPTEVASKVSEEAAEESATTSIITESVKPKYVDNSPLKKMADKKAAYESLLEEVVPEIEPVEYEILGCNVGEAAPESDKHVVTRQDSSGNAPIIVALSSVGGAAGLNSSKHVQKMKRSGGLPKRRRSGAALSVDELNLDLKEGGAGDIDRGARETQLDTVTPRSDANYPSGDDKSPDAVPTGEGRSSTALPEQLSTRSRFNSESFIEVDADAKDTIDRMLAGFNVEGLEDES